MPYHGNKRKKSRTHQVDKGTPLAVEAVPRSFVVSRGKSDKVARELVEDFREVMMPHTAARLKERK